MWAVVWGGVRVWWEMEEEDGCDVQRSWGVAQTTPTTLTYIYIAARLVGDLAFQRDDDI